MIVFKNKTKAMLDRLIQKLDKENIEDYELSEDIPEKSVGVTSDLDGVEVYIPNKTSYYQYDIDDYVRSLGSGLRTCTNFDRDIYKLKVKGTMTEAQYFKLIKYLIDLSDFVTIVKTY